MEWIELILKYDVIGKLSDGKIFSSINIDLSLSPDSDALRKSLNRFGIKRGRFQGLHYIKGYKEKGVVLAF